MGRAAMTIFNTEPCKPNVLDVWKAVYCFWPVCDIDGTWLILTEAERRPLSTGEYEYRALISND
jgi:hypothetical protein